jgi:hypothetical protein
MERGRGIHNICEEGGAKGGVLRSIRGSLSKMSVTSVGGGVVGANF